MNRMQLLFQAILIIWATSLQAASPPTELTNEHTDFRILYDSVKREISGIVVREEDRLVNFGANEVVLVVPEAARLSLPSGTPFGVEGSSLWALPQTQDPSLLYLGISAEGISEAVFAGPIVLRLIRVEGPGQFFAWQASSFGELEVRMNSADGLTPADNTSLIVGSHQHFNWGFNAPGEYRVTFQASGVLQGDGKEVSSLPTTFTFHVLPLPEKTPYQKWLEVYWPPSVGVPAPGPGADPDEDGYPNLAEYAFGLNPRIPTNASPLTIVTSSQQDGGYALEWHRNALATDVEWVLETRATLDSVPLLSSVTPTLVENQGGLEKVSLPLGPPSSKTPASGFFRVLVRMKSMSQ